MKIPNFASFARVDPQLHKTTQMHGFITGGTDMGYNQASVFGINFFKQLVNAVETIDCQISHFLP
jgi:hypothetical protein